MGQGTIVSNDGEGLYTVDLNFDNGRTVLKLAELVDQIAELEEQIVLLEDRYNDRLDDLRSERQAIDQLIDIGTELSSGPITDINGFQPANIIEEHNSIREDEGLPPLTESPDLNQLAELHAGYLGTIQELTHFGTNNDRVNDRANDLGLPTQNTYYENIVAAPSVAIDGTDGSATTILVSEITTKNIITNPNISQIGTATIFSETSPYIYITVIVYAETPGLATGNVLQDDDATALTDGVDVEITN